MNNLLCLPSGLIINLEQFRACIKTDLTECTIIIANSPPLPGSIQDYDCLKAKAQPSLLQ